MFESMICKNQSCHSQQHPVQSHKRHRAWRVEVARDLIQECHKHLPSIYICCPGEVLWRTSFCCLWAVRHFETSQRVLSDLHWIIFCTYDHFSLFSPPQIRTGQVVVLRQHVEGRSGYVFLGPNALILGCLKSLSGQIRARLVIENFRTCPVLGYFLWALSTNRHFLSTSASQVLSRDNYFCYHIIT